MQVFVLLKPWKNSSDTWVKYSSSILGNFVFRAWLILGWSSWLSLLIAAYLLCLLSVVIFEEKKNISAFFETELTNDFLISWRIQKSSYQELL